MTEQTLRDVSQRNPAEPRPASEDVFGRLFSRGPAVAADGGERGVATEPEEGTAEADDDGERRPVSEHRMKDVDQTPPDEDASANRVWERGGEPGVGDESDASSDTEEGAETASGEAADDGDEATGPAGDEASDE